MNQLDFGWGTCYLLLDALNGLYTRPFGGTTAIQNMTYGKDHGMPQLLKHIQDITENNTGNKYNYYVLTNGATQALNSCIRVMEKETEVDSTVYTSYTGFPFVESMINKTHSMARIKIDFNDPNDRKTIPSKGFTIVESPSNPEGDVHSGFFSERCVWDGVYHDKIYNATPFTQPNHTAFIGSLSKLLGVTGLRIGWVATNSERLALALENDILYENNTISVVSQKEACNILNNVNLDLFRKIGQTKMNDNRDILDKISKVFGPVQERGMFYFTEYEDKRVDILNKAEVTHKIIEGKDSKMIRLNIGQTTKNVQELVKRVKKIDKVKR